MRPSSAPPARSTAQTSKSERKIMALAPTAEKEEMETDSSHAEQARQKEGREAGGMKREAWSPHRTESDGTYRSYIEPRAPSRYPTRPKSARLWGAQGGYDMKNIEKGGANVAMSTLAKRRPQTAGAARRGSKSKRIEFFNKELSHHAVRVDIEVSNASNNLSRIDI